MTAISIAILLAFPIHGLATIVWEITAGDPDYYMSDAIIVRNSPDENFDVTAENPADFEWQDPIGGQVRFLRRPITITTT